VKVFLAVKDVKLEKPQPKKMKLALIFKLFLDLELENSINRQKFEKFINSRE
jgi:hypothetical protein